MTSFFRFPQSTQSISVKPRLKKIKGLKFRKIGFVENKEATIWLATCIKDFWTFCVNCHLGLTCAVHNTLRLRNFCAKVDLLKSEKLYKKGKCHFRVAASAQADLKRQFTQMFECPYWHVASHTW